MKITELLKIKIGAYRHIVDKSRSDMSVGDFIFKVGNILHENGMIDTLRGIADKDEQKQYKANNIPAATFSCLCGMTKADIKEKTGLIVIDIDAEDNEFLFDKSLRDRFKNKIFSLDYVALVSESCRGNGLYAVIPLPIDDNFKSYFRSLEEIFEDKFGLKIDKACSNINRLRFASYDPGILVKEDEVEIFEQLYENEEDVYNIESDLQYSTEDNLILYNVLKDLIMNGYSADDYYSWMVEGFRLGCFPDFGEEIFILLSENSNGFVGVQECQKKYRNFAANTKLNPEQVKRYYYKKATDILGSGWYARIRDELRN